MRSSGKLLLLFFFCYELPQTTLGQKTDSIVFTQSAENSIARLNKKYVSLNVGVDKKTVDYLHKFEKFEKKLKDKVLKKDTTVAADLFSASNNVIKFVTKRFDIKSLGGFQGSRLDSLITALGFLQTKNGSNPIISESARTLDEITKKLVNIDQLNQQLTQRISWLRQELTKLGMLKELRAYYKQVHYYKAQLEVLRKELVQTDKYESLLLSYVGKDPEFSAFFSDNSGFIKLFYSGGNNSGQSLTGLQTRYSVQEALQKLPLKNPKQFLSAQLQVVRQNLQPSGASVSHFDKDSDKVLAFVPNTEKSKSFKQRLQVGGNIQFGNTNRFLPTCADLGLKLGYKLNDRSLFEFGAACKLGLGKGFSQLQLTHEGFTLRSSLDWKLKGSIWLSGGYERLYLPTLESLHTISIKSWQNSGLLGLSKKYKVSGKLNGSTQLLFDFLANSAFPKRQPLIFRIGWNN